MRENAKHERLKVVDNLSNELVSWAKGRNVANKNQRSALILMAQLATPAGFVSAPVNLLIGLDGISTRAQAERALTGLLGHGLVSKQWDPDNYYWRYQLKVGK